MGDLIFTNAPVVPIIGDGFHGQSSTATHCRDSVNVPRVPKQQWLETNTLYYDDAEGPNRIGNYNVHPWKTGTEDSYKNAKISGDTVDGYNPMNVGAADPKA